MAPGHYTELFFLDEATALAAGHRPCWECRRDEFRAFQAAWRRATGTPDASAGAIDRVLQEGRVDPRTRRQIRFEAPLDDLPDGAFVLLPGDASSPLLVLGDGLLPWRPAGYGAARPRPSRTRCVVLTPWPTLAVLRAGYAPRSTRPTATRRIAGVRHCCVRRHWRHPEELLATAMTQLGAGQHQQWRKGLLESISDRRDRFIRRPVRAAERLRDDLVDHPKLVQILSREAHRLGGRGRLIAAAPQDGGAALGRDHRIHRVLEHQHPVRDRERDRAARTALADDHSDQRHRDLQARLDRAGDRLGLAALLGADPG